MGSPIARGVSSRPSSLGPSDTERLARNSHTCVTQESSLKRSALGLIPQLREGQGTLAPDSNLTTHRPRVFRELPRRFSRPGDTFLADGIRPQGHTRHQQKTARPQSTIRRLPSKKKTARDGHKIRSMGSYALPKYEEVTSFHDEINHVAFLKRGSTSARTCSIEQRRDTEDKEDKPVRHSDYRVHVARLLNKRSTSPHTCPKILRLHFLLHQFLNSKLKVAETARRRHRLIGRRLNSRLTAAQRPTTTPEMRIEAD